MTVRQFQPRLLQLRVDVPVDHHEIQPAVVVVIEELHTPTDERQAHLSGPRRVRRVREEKILLVPIQRVVLVGEVRDHDVPAATVVVVADGDPHRGLLGSVLAERAA